MLIKEQKLTKQAFTKQFRKLTEQYYLSENESPERDSFFKPPSSTLPTSGSEAIAKEIEELLAVGLDANIPQAHFEYAKMILSEDIQVKDFTTNKYSLACQHFELAAAQGHGEAALYAARMLIGTPFNNVEGLVITEYDDTRLDKIHAYYQIAAEINAKAAKASGTTNSLAANSIHRASIENRPTDKSMEMIVYEAFCRADTDRDGYIDGNEMRLLLTSLYFPPKFIEEELQAFGSGGRKPLNWAAFGNYYTLLQERTLALTVTPNN